MSVVRTNQVGSPRLDPTERLRHRLYEPLQLLWMLNPTRGPSYILPSINQQSLDFLSRWRAFLDALSWFCDYSHGGMTVSSVAGEDVPAGTRFWLVSKTERPLEHLKWILRLLEDTHQYTAEERAITQLTIAESSIAFSSDKVKNYRRFLLISIGKARKAIAEPLLGEYGTLLQALSDLTVSEEPLELCQASVAFDEHDFLNQLVEATTAIRSPSKWSLVRHYVARLQSWHRKSDLLLRFARQFPGLLDHHSCEWLGLPAGVALPQSDSKTNLQSALQRMLPKDQQDTAREMHAALSGLLDFDFESAFAQNYARERMSLVVHAELHLMEHFYLHGLRFVENERYIGCSKPSCYCCSLYMRYHPGNFVVRPSHGTAWVTWCPPLQGRVEAEDIRRHNLDVLNKVVGHLRRDVLNEVNGRFPRRDRRPDSTSGFGTRSY